MANITEPELEFNPAKQWESSFCSSKDRFVLVPRSPSSILSYWEWTVKRADMFRSGVLSTEILLKLFCAKSGQQKLEIKARWDTLKLYLTAPAPGLYYKGSLSFFTADGKPQSSLDSNIIQQPGGVPASGADYIPSSEERFRRQ